MTTTIRQAKGQARRRAAAERLGLVLLTVETLKRAPIPVLIILGAIIGLGVIIILAIWPWLVAGGCLWLTFRVGRRYLRRREESVPYGSLTLRERVGLWIMGDRRDAR